MFSLSKKIEFNEPEAVKFHLKIQSEANKKFLLPDFLKLKFLAVRKNTQISLLFDKLKPWEQAAFENVEQQHPYQIHKRFLHDMLQTCYVPPLEEYYDTKIIDFYLLDLHRHNDFVYSLGVKIFDAPLFKYVNAYQAPAEEKLANLLSKCIRDLNGRGPERVAAYIYEDRFILFVVAGLVSSFLRECAEDDETLEASVHKIMELLISRSLDVVCSKEYDIIPEKFIDIDLPQNQIVSVLSLTPFSINDFV